VRRLAAATAAAVAVTAAVLGHLFALDAGRSWGYLVQEHVIEAGVFAASLAAVGFAVVRRHPGHRLGWLFLAIAMLEGVSLLATGLAQRLAAAGVQDARLSWAAWAAGWLWVPGFVGMLSLVVLLFPEGRPASPRWRPVLLVAGGAVAVGSGAAALGRGFTTDVVATATNPVALPAVPDEALGPVLEVAFVVCVACGVAGAVDLVVRALRVTGAPRRQLAWFFVPVAALFATLPVDSPLLSTVVVAALPVGLGVAMLRHGLFDGDRLLGPTIVYTVLTVLVTATFALVAGVAGGQIGSDLGSAVLAALVVALAMAPVRAAVQRAVDRVLYGGRRDPYTALAWLGARLGAVPDPDAVPGELVGSVAAALRLPHVALTLAGESEPVAVHGEPLPGAGSLALPIRRAGTEIGSVTVGLRPGRRHLDEAGERLLGDFVTQAGPAVHAVLLVRELRRSRDHVVDERDAERARIRRDLHDGLGPVLAGVALGIEAAVRAPQRSTELLGRLDTEVRAGLADVRRIVADLRPVELEYGLIPALRRFAADVTTRSGGELLVEVDAPTMPLRLPEHVEVAGYRIAREAVTNVVRHAGAAHCCVVVSAGPDELSLEVRDDGCGLPAAPVPGIGRESMARRAAETGGTCTTASRPDGGTSVLVVLPLAGGRPDGP
jgi:signal transduction histidine kinase